MSRSFRAALLGALLAACGSSGHSPTPDETAVRTRLGVPAGAKTVVVVSQTAHLDIDWQHSFDDYYTMFVSDVFTEAGGILAAQPRATYSIAEMAYLERHLSAHPDQVDGFKAAAARGALRIVGGGMTSPDTLLPETELLARDYLYGIRFAEDQLGAHPHAAWLPDSFGHSATVPDLLAAAGFTSVGFARVNGAPTLIEAALDPHILPKPGSTAELLANLGSDDFVWRGAGGAKVLAHWMASGLYCTGDNIDYDETLQVPGGHLGAFKGDDPSFTDAKLDSYVAALLPYAKTPYRFVTVGCDFQHPKPRLLEYLDGYNQRRYPVTGVWVVAASFEDYEQLVGAWRDHLPELALDLTPYFMGFYGSRAEVKGRTRDAARGFFTAETFAVALGEAGRTLMQGASAAFSKLTRADHHDFVTGTSTDDVVALEQLPQLAEAQAAGQAALSAVAAALARRIPVSAGARGRVLVLNPSGRVASEVAEVALPLVAGAPPVVHAVAGGQPVAMELATPAPGDTTVTARLAVSALPPFSWRMIELQDGAAAAPAPAVTLELSDAQGAPASGAAVARVVLSNAHVRAEWSQPGFLLTSLRLDGVEVVAQGSFAVHDYNDTGGLWRTGNEMDGCVLAPVASAGGDVTVEVLEATPLLARVAFHAADAVREAALGAGAPGLSLALTSGAQTGTTRTVSLSLAVPKAAMLTTSSPGGYLTRPAEKLYTPTFWPAVGWASVGGVAVLLRQSTGARMSTPGELELMAVRNAPKEHCDILGGEGTDTGTHRIEWRIERAATPAAAEAAAQAWNRPLDLERVGTAVDATTDLAAQQSLLTVEGEGVVSALKPAERGAGVIVRALLMPGPVKLHLSPALAALAPGPADLAERDLGAASPPSATVTLDRAHAGAIATIRLR